MQVDLICVWDKEKDGSHNLPARAPCLCSRLPGQSIYLSWGPLLFRLPCLSDCASSGWCLDLPTRRAHWAGRWDDNDKESLINSLHTILRGLTSQDYAREIDPALPSDHHWLLVPLPSLGTTSYRRISYFPKISVALTAEKNTRDG